MFAKPLTFGSLFSGIGGIDLGFERAGMRCIWQSEIDPYASKVLKKHWPEIPNYGDVTKINWEKVERPNIIAGGFPCQDISYAGKGAGIHGERSGLFFELMRAVRVVRPRIVVLENVAALLARGLGVVLGELAACGFDAEWNVVSAAMFGSPHIRERVFIVAHAKYGRVEERRRTSSPFSRRGERTGIHAAHKSRGGEQAESVFANASFKDDWQDTAFANKGQKSEPRKGVIGRFGSWLPEPAVGRVVHGVPNRMDRIRGLGNAVVPQVAEFIGQRIVETFTEIEHAH